MSFKVTSLNLFYILCAYNYIESTVKKKISLKLLFFILIYSVIIVMVIIKLFKFI